jgi:hypothetical protein
MATDLSICNTALLMANATTINSFNDSTREAAMCDAMFQTTKETILSKHPWSFSLFQEKLARTTNTPLFDFTYEFQLPTGYIRTLKTDQSGNNYRVLKDKLFSDYKEVEILYQKDPGVEFYPAYFVRLLEFKMAEILSLSLVQDEAMATRFQQAYLLSMREARGIDSQNSPNLTIAEGELTLTAARGSDT